MLPDRTICFKAVGAHKAGGTKARFCHSLASVNNREETEKRHSFLHVSAKILPNWPLGSYPKAHLGLSKASVL